MKRESTFKIRNIPDHVADHIVLMIAQGKLSSGDRIFEKEICDILKVSRIPVREALRLLQAQGVVRTEPNRGTFITDFGSAETAELLELRLTVERIAMRRVLARLADDPSILGPLEDSIEEMRKASLLEDRLGFCQADLGFHTQLIEMADSPMLRPIWNSLSRGILVFTMEEQGVAVDYDESIRDHRLLLDLIRSGNPTAVDRELDRHINGYVGLHRQKRKVEKTASP